jgi:bacteriochlorophyll 4-vinyl reductase
MEPTGTQPGSKPRPAGRKAELASISPLFPLLMLQTMRDQDRPEEVLEDEDITLSLPRRLGLSEVVRVQIHRFEEEARHNRPQHASSVEDLVRLVIRRPDAADIFVEAGRRVSRHFWGERSGWAKRLIRFLPRPLALMVAQRAARRMFRLLVGPTRFRFSRKPVSLRIDQPLTLRGDPSGAACSFYSGALWELLELYTGRRYRVLHSACAGRKAGATCEWTVEMAD